MTIVLDIVHPVQLLKQIFKNGMLPPFSTGALPKGAKKGQEIVSSLDEGNRSIARSVPKKTMESIKNFNHVDCITPSSKCLYSIYVSST